MDRSILPTSEYPNALGSGPTYNLTQNVIAGPDALDYWNHSPGAQRAMVREEGSFPVQGNIGSLIAAEAVNFRTCVAPNKYNSIGGSNNCSAAFQSDIYTKKDTCGSECYLKNPEIYGLKNFGFPDQPSDLSVTNAHQIHAYQNLRAGMPGQDGSYGGLENIPRVSVDPKRNTVFLNPEPVYDQVGNFLKLKNYENITYADFRK